MAWLWSGLAWGLTGLGVAVLLWSLLWDRAGWCGRPAVRWGKCWYDLGGSFEGMKKPRGARRWGIGTDAQV